MSKYPVASFALVMNNYQISAHSVKGLLANLRLKFGVIFRLEFCIRKSEIFSFHQLLCNKIIVGVNIFYFSIQRIIPDVY
jgi:hypothetical protein